MEEERLPSSTDPIMAEYAPPLLSPPSLPATSPHTPSPTQSSLNSTTRTPPLLMTSPPRPPPSHNKENEKFRLAATLESRHISSGKSPRRMDTPASSSSSSARFLTTSTTDCSPSRPPPPPPLPHSPSAEKGLGMMKGDQRKASSPPAPPLASPSAIVRQPYKVREIIARPRPLSLECFGENNSHSKGPALPIEKNLSPETGGKPLPSLVNQPMASRAPIVSPPPLPIPPPVIVIVPERREAVIPPPAPTHQEEMKDTEEDIERNPAMPILPLPTLPPPAAAASLPPIRSPLPVQQQLLLLEDDEEESLLGQKTLLKSSQGGEIGSDEEEDTVDCTVIYSESLADSPQTIASDNDSSSIRRLRVTSGDSFISSWSGSEEEHEEETHSTSSSRRSHQSNHSMRLTAMDRRYGRNNVGGGGGSAHRLPTGGLSRPIVRGEGSSGFISPPMNGTESGRYYHQQQQHWPVATESYYPHRAKYHHLENVYEPTSLSSSGRGGGGRSRGASLVLSADSSRSSSREGRRSISRSHRASPQQQQGLLKASDKPGISNARNSSGESALHLACAKVFVDGVKILIANGADVNARDSLGRTPLHATCTAQDCRMGTRTISLLLEAEANAAAADELGNTPAHLTALCGWDEALLEILKKGAKASMRNHDGDTPLHFATKNTHLQCMEHLMAWVHGPPPPSPCIAKEEAIEESSCDGKSSSSSSSAVKADVEGLSAKEVLKVYPSSYCEERQSQQELDATTSIQQPIDLSPSYEGSYEEDGSYPPSTTAAAAAYVQQAEMEAVFLWMECSTEEGYVYYYNSVTGVSQWENPWVGSGSSYEDQQHPVAERAERREEAEAAISQKPDTYDESITSWSTIPPAAAAATVSSLITDITASPQQPEDQEDDVYFQDVMASIDGTTTTTGYADDDGTSEAAARSHYAVPAAVLSAEMMSGKKRRPTSLFHKFWAETGSKPSSSSTAAESGLSASTAAHALTTPPAAGWTSREKKAAMVWPDPMPASELDEIMKVCRFADDMELRQRMIIECCIAGRTQDVETLLLLDVSPSTTDQVNRSLLHHGVRRGHMDIVALLGSLNIDVDAEDVLGHTSLHVAAEFGEEDALTFLLECAATVDRPNKDSYSPLHFAAQGGFVACAQKLVEYGAPTHLLNHRGLNPYYNAIRRGQRLKTDPQRLLETLAFLAKLHGSRNAEEDDRLRGVIDAAGLIGREEQEGTKEKENVSTGPDEETEVEQEQGKDSPLMPAAATAAGGVTTTTSVKSSLSRRINKTPVDDARKKPIPPPPAASLMKESTVPAIIREKKDKGPSAAGTSTVTSSIWSVASYLTNKTILKRLWTSVPPPTDDESESDDETSNSCRPPTDMELRRAASGEGAGGTRGGPSLGPDRCIVASTTKSFQPPDTDKGIGSVSSSLPQASSPNPYSMGSLPRYLQASHRYLNPLASNNTPPRSPTKAVVG